MLPIDVTSDTGEETERGQKQKNIVKNNNCSKVRHNRGGQVKRQASLNITLRVKHVMLGLFVSDS